jgi:hypothetical protein
MHVSFSRARLEHPRRVAVVRSGTTPHEEVGIGADYVDTLFR